MYSKTLSHAHIHMSIISMSCLNNMSLTYCLFISGANLSSGVGDGYSFSLASDASLHSYEYSLEDKPYSLFPLIYSERITAKIDFFTDMA